MKKANTVFLSFWLIGLFLVQCTAPGWDTKKYYFPLKELKEGKVYAFENQGNIGPSEVYWYYRSIVGSDEVYLTATYYENQPAPMQLVTEKLVQNGMRREELFLFEEDSLGKSQRIKAKIEVGDAFPFFVKEKGGIFLQKQSWIDASSGHEFTLVKNRVFLGDTLYRWGENNLDAIYFEVKELLVDEGEGSLELEFKGKEVYAKGMGLVYYEKELEKGVVMAYGLKEIMEMEELVQLLLKF